MRKPEVRALCRREDEIRAKQQAELRLRERIKKELEDRGKADSVADAAFEFWTLMGEVWTEFQPNDEEENDTSATHYEVLATPSPADSITVTTEFGVSAEPSNITTITAAPPTTPNVPELDGQEIDHHHEDNEHEPHHGDTEDEAALSVSDNSTAAPGTTPDSPDTLPADMADDEGDDADLDDLDDDFDDEELDAESALIDQFIDDGALIGNHTH